MLTPLEVCSIFVGLAGEEKWFVKTKGSEKNTLSTREGAWQGVYEITVQRIKEENCL